MCVKISKSSCFNRSILFVLLVLFVVYAKSQNIDNITISDIFKTDRFTPKYPHLNFLEKGYFYTELYDSAIIKYSSETGKKVEDLLTLDMLPDSILNIAGYELSKDEKKIIFYTNKDKIYRRSFMATYYVWDIDTQKLYRVSDNKSSQQLATLSPDGNRVAYIYNNNIFITELRTGKEQEVTKDGEKNKVINGATDWVYEEEFGKAKAYEWSPDGKYIAYCKFDETDVEQFNITIFKGLNPEKTENRLYPQNYIFKYPKAGKRGSVVSVYIYNTDRNRTVKVDVGNDTTQYIPRIIWSPNGKLVVYRLNHLQNKLEFLYADTESGETNIFYSETNKRYIDEIYFDNLEFINNGDKFVYTSERDGYAHIYMYRADGKLLKQLTKGAFDVTNYLGCDCHKNIIYYQVALPTPLHRSIYSCNMTTQTTKKINKKDGFNYAIFDSKCNHYINYYSSSKELPSATLYTNKGDIIRVLDDNIKLKQEISQVNFSYREFFTFKTKDSVVLNGWIMKPKDFNEKKKYPILLIQYSGPNSQKVLDEFELGWEQVLVSKGYIVACVDPRGTGGRGEDFRKTTYLQLGKYETSDQIETARYLGSLSYVDSDRIGIWGWSYGGFIALNCMMHGADYFKMGIAVAPVTNWRYYDNIYTERFMRTPQENTSGYDENSPITYVDSLRGKLLIIHGSADDNVHMQNTLEFTEALVQADKQFDMFIYTNRNHSIYGGNTRNHLFTKMLRYIEENL
jgi:dipeptidyl-peptidase-4